MNKLFQTALLSLFLLTAVSTCLLAVDNSRPAVQTEGSEVVNATSDNVQTATPSYTVRSTSVVWDVVSSGGTQATIGTDKYLFGTVVQTAIGEITSPNYIIHQGFWQNFAKPCVGADADGNGYVSIGDAVFIVNYIFGGGPAPSTSCGGDANNDGSITVADAVAIVMTVFVP